MTAGDLGASPEELPFATIDHLRPLTQGHQEVIFAQGKTPEQVVAIAERLSTASGTFLATRTDGDHQVAVVHGQIRFIGTVHSDHAEEMRVGRGEGAEPHQGQGARRVSQPYKLGEATTGFGAGVDQSAAAIE